MKKSQLFEYFHLQPDGKKRKLAIGEHQAAWLRYEKHETRETVMVEPLPPKIREALLKKISTRS